MINQGKQAAGKATVAGKARSEALSEALAPLLVSVGLVGLFCLVGATAVNAAAGVAFEQTDAAFQKTDANYQTHCADCHGAERLGAMGPALLPQNLKRLRQPKAAKVIANGRVATQMPSFGDKLDSQQIEQLVDYIYRPLATMPVWGMDEMLASQIINHPYGSLPDTPSFEADMQNLFMVVELADHHVTVLDGDKFEPIHRFPSRFALHGGPKYSPDGRYVFFASRDGWISKFDVYNLKVVAEIRAGINTRNLAVSGDGRYVMVANYLPHSLVVLDTKNLKPLKIIKTEIKDPEDPSKMISSRVSAVYAAPPRNSFIAGLKDTKEVWEISYDDNPGNDYAGWVHDYEDNASDARKLESFPIRRTKSRAHLDDFFFDQSYSLLLGTSREGEGLVLSLDSRREVSSLEIEGMPHLSSGITWEYEGRTVMASPNIKKGAVSIIDMDSWKTIKEIKTEGPGFFMRSHENSPYAWVDVFFGPNKDKVHVIDKSTLEIVKTLRPVPGKTAAHVEFTKDGRYALLSIWDNDGALIVYDANTLEEVKRLPMKKPSGKYNVHNKTKYSAGTSH
ncbi:MAG: cytochrome D1 domain-containing protein [Motiliproteus sp.]